MSECSRSKDRGYSQNEYAERLMGYRRRGTPLFGATELGYACPICHADGETNFTFSEYNYFMYCYKCDLDIPSCLCRKYPEPRFTDTRVLKKKDRIELETKIFLKSVEEAIEDHYRPTFIEEIKERAIKLWKRIKHD